MYYFNGFNENVCTFKASGELAVGTPVSMCDNHTVKAADANNVFIGIAATADRNGAVAVQLSGCIELPYSGSAPGVGYGKFVADGNGCIALGDNGKELLVVAVDTVANTITAIM